MRVAQLVRAHHWHGVGQWFESTRAYHPSLMSAGPRRPNRSESDDSFRSFSTTLMSQVTITLPDGSSRSVPAGTTVADLATSISPGLAKAALAWKVDSRLVDIWYALKVDASVQIIRSKNADEALPLYRHGTAHLLAAAVTNLFPGVQGGIGPTTEEGFFYDFVVPRPFVPE